MKKETKGTLLALLTALVSGIAIPLNKLFIVSIDPTVFAAVRAIIIGAIFFFIASYQSRFNYKEFKHVPFKYLIAIGVIGGGFAFLLLFCGLANDAGKHSGAFLHDGTLPIYTTLLAAVFLNERITRRMSYAMIVMVVGVAVLYASQLSPAQLWANPLLGDLLITVSVILWAIEYVIAKKAMNKGESNTVITFARMFFGSIVLFGFVFLFGKVGSLMTLSVQQWTNILISTGLEFCYVAFWYWSLKNINASKATMLFLVAPVVSTIASMMIFSEQPSIMQFIGSAVILIGAYFLLGVKSESRKKA